MLTPMTSVWQSASLVAGKRRIRCTEPLPPSALGSSARTHPDTLVSRYEVGFALSRTGRTADALREYTYVARAREQVLGPEHPDTLAAGQEK